MWFKKIGLFLFTFLFTACVSHTVIKTPDAPTIQELGREATIAFVDSSPLSAEIYPYCTGVWVNRNTLLTALHCAQGSATMAEVKKLPPELQKLPPSLLMHFFVHKVVNPTGHKMNYVVSNDVVGIGLEPKKQHEAVVVNIDLTHDLALLKADINDIPHHGWLRIADHMPQVGEKVYSVGHPGGLYYTYLEGVVAAIRETFPHDGVDDMLEGPFIQIYSGIYKGNSGGAVISQKGEIVGIVSFVATRVPGQGFAIGTPSIKRFIYKSFDAHLL